RVPPRDSGQVVTPFVRVGTYPTRNFAGVLAQRELSGRLVLAQSSLHVAMQSGPSLYPMSRTSDVWSLRILISSCLGFSRVFFCMISRLSMRRLRFICRSL